MNLILDVVEVLYLNNADVLLQHALEHLLLVRLVLFALRWLPTCCKVGPRLFSAHHSLQVVLEIFIEVSLLVEQS